MKKFCVSCEQETLHEEQLVKIPVGRREYETTTRVCMNCGAYSKTAKLRKQIDEWAHGLKSSFMDVQPRLSELTRQFIQEESDRLGVPRATYVRWVTAFYIHDVVHDPIFNDVRAFLQSQKAYRVAEQGKKDTEQVLIRYRAFRQLEVIAAAWNVTVANVMEEAILFVVSLKYYDRPVEFAALVERLNKYLEMQADAA